MDEQFQDLFKIRRNRKKVEIGNILIAEPFLQGKYFSRSVIFMVEHDEKGSIGFVLNKPMAYTTSDLVTELAGLEYPVYIGGPVEQNQLYYLHNHAEVEDALQIVPGIYWGGDFSKLTRLLDRELDENSWMVGDITPARFFEIPNDNLWEASMSGLGGRYRIWANFPKDPIMN